MAYASIPEPEMSLDSLHEAVSALKQTVEALIGLRGTSDTTVATQADIANVPFRAPTYLVSTLPPASTASFIVYVSNESGGAVLAFSDGTDWRRVTDRAIVS